MEDGNYYPIVNSKENQVLIELANDRDFSHLNLWSKVQDVKRHYKRIKMKRRHIRQRDRENYILQIVGNHRKEITDTGGDEESFDEKVLMEDSESEDEETKKNKKPKL